MAKVYHFTVWDQVAGEKVRQRHKSTKERIASIPTAEILDGSEEEVDDALIDDGRYAPAR